MNTITEAKNQTKNLFFWLVGPVLKDVEYKLVIHDKSSEGTWRDFQVKVLWLTRWKLRYISQMCNRTKHVIDTTPFIQLFHQVNGIHITRQYTTHIFETIFMCFFGSKGRVNNKYNEQSFSFINWLNMVVKLPFFPILLNSATLAPFQDNLLFYSYILMHHQ